MQQSFAETRLRHSDFSAVPSSATASIGGRNGSFDEPKKDRKILLFTCDFPTFLD